jgi:hypothetical protein
MVAYGVRRVLDVVIGDSVAVVVWFGSSVGERGSFVVFILR